MRIPFEWLKELVDLPPSLDELGSKLTMIGLEVESVETIHNEPVLEVNVTPNRSDCLSVLGIAREVSALLDIPLRVPEHQITEEIGESRIAVTIADSDLCHRYAGRDIAGVRIGESPGWMKKRLEQCGMRPINSIVDITNYVLLEMGHPLHAFDRETLQGSAIRVGRSQPGGTITTLDGTVRELPEDALLIWDGERPVAVAGIMGGSETEVTDRTTNVFLESAYFLPTSIRRTSRKFGLKTESSYRFERGTDIEGLIRALNRAALLMGRIAGGVVSKSVDVYPTPSRTLPIEVRYARVNKILGLPIIPEEIISILKRLGFVIARNELTFLATPPSYRTDIQREIDVIEEVARFYGYDRIPVTVPRSPIGEEHRENFYSQVATVRASMRNAGFSEAVNYSFMNVRMLGTLGVPPGDSRRRTLVLVNPINVEESHLRTTLVPSLLKNLASNIMQGTREVRLFEVSRVFRDQGELLPEEKHHLGAVYFKEKTPTLWKDDAPDFYIVKGAFEALRDTLGIKGCSYRPSPEPFLHPGKSCDILIGTERIGFLGVIHPGLVERLDLKIPRGEVVLVEIDLDMLLGSVPGTVPYTPLPKYPPIDRDVALIVDESIPAAAIREYMETFPTELVEEVSVFDYYRGKNIPAGKKSLAFSIRYRSKDRTLTDAEIEELHTKLVSSIVEKTGATVRGH